MISDKKAIQDIVQLLELKGVKHIIITPGSRNAPFSISLFKHPAFEVHSVVDERSAAYIALGMAQQTDCPVALICTSGTAALNYAPAVAEAFYQEIPLIVITADRPMEWVNQGEGQTINQSGIFKNYVRASYDIVQDMNDRDFEWYNARVMNEAIDRAMSPVRGPVHLNFPLRESLYKTTESYSHNVKNIHTLPLQKTLAPAQIQELVDVLSNKKKIMILVGQFHTNPETRHLLEIWAQKDNVVVMTESHSGLESPLFMGCIDRMIMTMSEVELDDFRPEIVISIGKNIISKKIKSLLRHDRVEHWYVSEDGLVMDTFQRLTRIIPITPERFFNYAQSQQYTGKSDYRTKYKSLYDEKRRVADEYVNQSNFSDLTVSKIIMDTLPNDSLVQMGNSSIARYIQLFDRNDSLVFSGNRGVSGIDGCTSTAVGAAFVSNKVTTLISGDIAFLYDSNAFWNKLVRPNLKIIVINNGGGGIFRIIEGPNTTEALDEFFETTHLRNCNGIAQMYGLHYISASDEAELKQGLQELYSYPNCCVLEVFTPRLENDKILKGFFKYIREKTSK
jgi:2-succinyl-5-enolpyruvyl-6-hydroxy-3-cyclohexene-1-carboxylate synthase